MKYYTYTHTRLDTNEVFYIGIGTKSDRNYSTYRSTYYRAHKKTDRNIIWKRITQKTEYSIQIVFESDIYDEVKCKEKELIAFYGKKSHYGSLCNLTDGGDGTLGCKKPMGKDSKFSKPVYQYSKNGDFIKRWDCGNDVTRELKYYANSIYNCCNKKASSAYGYQWSYKETSNIGKLEVKSGGTVVLQLLKDGQLVREWKNALTAEKHTGIKSSHITSCCHKKKNRKTAGGFKWEFKNKKIKTK